MQVGGDEIADRSPKAIKGDFRALGRLVEESRAQVVFSSIPALAEKSTERGRKTHLVNRWLRDWCLQWNISFFDHGEVYMAWLACSLIMEKFTWFTWHRPCW